MFKKGPVILMAKSSRTRKKHGTHQRSHGKKRTQKWKGKGIGDLTVKNPHIRAAVTKRGAKKGNQNNKEGRGNVALDAE